MQKIIALTAASMLAALIPGTVFAQSAPYPGSSDPTQSSPNSPVAPTSPTTPGSVPTTPTNIAPGGSVSPLSSTCSGPIGGGTPTSSTYSTGGASSDSTYSTSSSRTSTYSTVGPNGAARPTGMNDTTGSMSMNSTSMATTSQATGVSGTMMAPRIIKASSDQVEYNNIIGPTHSVELAVGSNAMCSLSIKPLQDVQANDDIQVRDAAGNSIPATVTKQEDGGAIVTFAQPIAPGSMLNLEMQGVEYYSSLTPTVIQYSISGDFAGYSQPIPYGTAQVNRYLR
ncbi:MAG TPA: hypothetical protein V6D19_05790 [Stenomitos sp.]